MSLSVTIILWCGVILCLVFLLPVASAVCWSISQQMWWTSLPQWNSRLQPRWRTSGWLWRWPTDLQCWPPCIMYLSDTFCLTKLSELVISDCRLNSFGDSFSLQNINNQLCKVSVKARLGHPLGRGGMVGLRGQMRGGGGRRGLVKGFYTRRSEWQSKWERHQDYIIYRKYMHVCFCVQTWVHSKV